MPMTTTVVVLSTITATRWDFNLAETTHPNDNSDVQAGFHANIFLLTNKTRTLATFLIFVSPSSLYEHMGMFDRVLYCTLYDIDSALLTVYDSSTQELWSFLMYDAIDFSDVAFVAPLYFLLLIIFVGWLAEVCVMIMMFSVVYVI